MFSMIIIKIPTIVDNDVNGVRIYYNENTKQSVLYPVPNYQVQDLMRIIGTRAHRKKLADATTIVLVFIYYISIKPL